MNPWYVATLARYVIVQAQDESEARCKGESQLGTAARTVRPATPDEVQLQRWHEQEARRDAQR